MPNQSDLLSRADAVRKEIADLDQAVAGIPPLDVAQRETLERLRTVRALRDRELKDIEAQLSQKH